MYLRVFQINPDRDEHRLRFERLADVREFQGGERIDASLYDEVFRGEVDCETLEHAYALFNLVPPPLHRGHSMSVSDVIQTEEGCYYCDAVGFEKVDFDLSLTHKQDNLLRIVMVEPGLPAYESEIENRLEALQRAVGGNMEITSPFYREDGTVIVSNDEAKLIGMPGNRTIGGRLYAGPFFLVGDDRNGELQSLTDEQVEKYCGLFQTPELYTQEEVEESIGFTFYGF